MSSLNFKIALQIAKESHTEDGPSSTSAQGFLQLPFPQLQEPTDGYLMCKMLIKANLQRIRGGHIVTFQTSTHSMEHLGGNLAPRILLLQLGSHLEHDSHSEMSFEVKTHLFIIWKSVYKHSFHATNKEETR